MLKVRGKGMKRCDRMDGDGLFSRFQTPMRYMTDVARRTKTLVMLRIWLLVMCIAQGAIGNVSRNSKCVNAEGAETVTVSDTPKVSHAQSSLEKNAQKFIAHYRKAAEQGDVWAQERLGWIYYGKDRKWESKAEAIRWWSKVGSRGSEHMKSILRLGYHGEERELIDNAADAITAIGGLPVPDSNEPLAFRIENGRKAYIGRWLGFRESTWHPFPALIAVKKTTSFDLDFARRFETAVKGKMASFPNGEIRWTEDGTNGFSFADTAIRINKIQICCVRELMLRQKFECSTRNDNDKSMLAWILNDNFMFGYMTAHKSGKDKVYYVFTTRRDVGGRPPKTCFIVDFAPTQLMSDSIMGACLGDDAANFNLKKMEDAGIVTIIE